MVFDEDNGNICCLFFIKKHTFFVGVYYNRLIDASLISTNNMGLFYPGVTAKVFMGK